MKFLSTVNKIFYLEDAQCELLNGVKFFGHSGRIQLDNWGNGWVFESDEYFPTFCVIRYGFEPVEITDDEYRQLIIDGITFVDKSRARKIIQAVKNMRATQ
jgi:hypothetical protein